MSDQRRNREEVVNTSLALYISRFGVDANAETIEQRGVHRPDVIFLMNGLRVAIEGKFADVSGARESVTADAIARIRAGVAHLAVAVVYPQPFRHARTAEIAGLFSSEILQFRIESEAGESAGWFDGTASDILESLRRAREGLASDDLVQRTADSLSVRLAAIARLWEGQSGTLERLSELLRIPVSSGETREQARDRRESAAKISALVLANALIFQEQLSATDERVRTLRHLAAQQDVVSEASRHWRWIWETRLSP